MLLCTCALSPLSLSVLRKTCSCTILKVLLLLIAFIWIPIISRNYSWDCTSLSANSWDFLGWTIPRNTIWTDDRNRKIFLFYSSDGELYVQKLQLMKSNTKSMKQQGTETLSLESQTVPGRQFTFDHEITPCCSVFASPGWQLVECHKCCSTSECCMGNCSSQQLCPSLGKANLYRWAATLSLAGAQTDVHQDILMAGKPKGEGHFSGGRGRLLSFKYHFLPSPADATNCQFAIWFKKLRANSN